MFGVKRWLSSETECLPWDLPWASVGKWFGSLKINTSVSYDLVYLFLVQFQQLFFRMVSRRHVQERSLQHSHHAC